MQFSVEEIKDRIQFKYTDAVTIIFMPSSILKRKQTFDLNEMSFEILKLKSTD
jgi:hypothetical protein